ncbi:MAG: hypothetical protein AAGE93_18785 [Bacteroidota bacterium]
MTQHESFYESKTARVYFDTELDTLFLEYLSGVKSHDEFVEINSSVLAAFKKLNTQKFVADIRRMGIISLESQQWVVQHLLPGMVGHLNGAMLYHAQFLDPSEVFSKVSGSSIKKKSSNEIEAVEFEQFSDRKLLEDYLTSIQ